LGLATFPTKHACDGKRLSHLLKTVSIGPMTLRLALSQDPERVEGKD
jgi:hypothetical protein